MRRASLRELLFLALCCDLGLVCKRLAAPAANAVTGLLRIPGGISTGFSLMFLTVACELVPRAGCGAAMGLVQAALALVTGRVGSMGALAPVGYALPGLAIDCALAFGRRLRLPLRERLAAAGLLSSLTAALAANAIVFRLRGTALLLYALVASTTGVCTAWPARRIVRLVSPVLRSSGPAR